MPIEIKELHIKINVDETRNSQKVAPKNDIDINAIVNTCVEEVIEQLKEKNER